MNRRERRQAVREFRQQLDHVAASDAGPLTSVGPVQPPSSPMPARSTGRALVARVRGRLALRRHITRALGNPVLPVVVGVAAAVIVGTCILAYAVGYLAGRTDTRAGVR